MRTQWIVALCCALAAAAGAQNAEDWQLLGENKLAQVSAEKVLYKDAKQGGFYVHVRIHKKAGGSLGVSRQSLINPNQWSFQAGPQRGVIDEETTILPAVDPQELMAQYRQGSMQAIPGDLDYYGHFDGAVPGKPDFDKARYLLVSMYGRLLLSDGKTAETLLADLPTDLAIPLPLRWKPLPREANLWLSENK